MTSVPRFVGVSLGSIWHRVAVVLAKQWQCVTIAKRFLAEDQNGFLGVLEFQSAIKESASAVLEISSYFMKLPVHV